MGEDDLLSQLFTADQVFGQPQPSPLAQPGTEQMTGLDAERMHQILAAPDQQQQMVDAEARQGQLAYWPFDGTPAPTADQLAHDALGAGEQAANTVFFPAQALNMAGLVVPGGMRPRALVERIIRGNTDAEPRYDTNGDPVNAGGNMEMPDQLEEGGMVYDAPNESTISAATLDIGPGGGLISAPGEEGRLPVPSEALSSYDAFHSWLSGAVDNFEGPAQGRPSLVPGAVSLPREVAVALERQYISRIPAGPQQAAGSGRPDDFLTQRLQTNQTFVPPGAQAALDAANRAAAGAQIRSDFTDQVVQAGGTESLNLAAEAQKQSALLAAQQDAERQQLIMRRVAAFDSTLADVRAMRVDPNAFYGGMAGRVTATIAVALGQLGSLLTGGPNVALETINQGIERNIAAQNANINNAQQSAQMQGSALEQFRSILGDEAAARGATRAALLQAYATQLDGMVSGLRGPQLQAAQQLRMALAQQAADAAEAARQTVTLASDFQTRRAVPASAPQQVFGQMQQRGAAQQAEAVRLSNRQAYDQAAAMQEAGDAAGAAQVFQRMLSQLPPDSPQTPVVRQAAENALGEAQGVEGFDVPQAADAPAEQRPAPRRPAGNGLAGTPPVRQAQPSTQVLTRFQQTQEEALDRFLEVQRQEQRLEGTQTQAPRGYRLTNPTLYRAALNSDGRSETMSQIMSDMDTLTNFWQRVENIRTRYNAEVTDAEAQVVLANQMIRLVRDQYRVRITGAGASDDEREEYREALPDIGRVTVDNVSEWWDAVGNHLWGYYNATMRSLGNRLNRAYGVVPASPYWTTYQSQSQLHQVWNERLSRAQAAQGAR